MSDIIIAADLGGTNLRMAAIKPNGDIVSREKVDTPRSRMRDEVTNTVSDLALKFRHDSGSDRIRAFGIAAPAVINSANGSIFYSPNLPDLNGFDLAKAVAERVAMPVYIENDATAAAIGEQWLGASAGADCSICVTLGTGVGGGVIFNGEPHRGIDGTAGEIGHICVEPFGVECGCGSRGCIEQYASASAIVRMATELTSEFPDSPLAGRDEFESVDVFDAGSAGDPLALKVFERVGFYLGIGLAGLVNVLNPEVIVIGGGASAGWDLFMPEVRKQVRERAFQRPAERVRIVPAALGDDAGILGAAKVALRSLE